MLLSRSRLPVLLSFVILAVFAVACGGGNATPEATPTLALTPTPAIEFTQLKHTIGFTVRYPRGWVIIKDTSRTGVDPFDIVYDASGKISRVVVPIVLISARTEESASLQQTFQVIIGPRIVSSDGPISPEREFNIHLQLFNIVKGEFIDRVQEDKDGLTRFVSEVLSPTSLPGTDGKTHIFDHFWITDTATWQVTCSTSEPPPPEAKSTCLETLDSFILTQ